MITENKLDVRTITMGISLRDCAHPNIDKFCQNVYDKITKSAEFLVKTGEDIEAEYEAMAKQYELEIEKVKSMVPAEEVKTSLETRKAVKVIVDAAVPVAPKAKEEATEE